MLYSFIYYLTFFGIIGYLLWYIVNQAFFIYSHMMGAPYVPTRKEELMAILERAGLKKGQKFIDVGCGDGRVSILAAKEFGADATGIDINPLLTQEAKTRAHLQHIKGVTFRTADVLKTNYSGYDVIYIYLFPQIIQKLRPKLEKEAKGSVIISHWFPIKNWGEYLIDTGKTGKYETYYYRVT